MSDELARAHRVRTNAFLETFRELLDAGALTIDGLHLVRQRLKGTADYWPDPHAALLLQLRVEAELRRRLGTTEWHLAEPGIPDEVWEQMRAAVDVPDDASQLLEDGP
jgi:hypothetical protein